MKVKDVMGKLNFKNIQVIRLSKRKGINEYYFFKIGNKIHIIEVYLINKFALKEEANVLNIPFEIWLDFYKAKAIDNDTMDKIIEIFVENRILEEYKGTEKDWGNYMIEKIGSYLVFYRFEDSKYKIVYVMKIEENKKTKKEKKEGGKKAWH